MPLIKKIILAWVLSGVYLSAFAQIEVARLMTKTIVPDGFGHLVSQNLSATGFGAFLNLGFSVREAGSVSAEGGFYYFKIDDNNIAIAPVLIGYRQVFTGNDYGFYLEPLAGYTFGGTDLQKSNALGNPLYQSNGNQLDQKVAGATTGIGFGYLFQPSGRIRFNLGIRYEHTFVTGDPSLNIFSIRLSHAFSFGRRDDY